MKRITKLSCLLFISLLIASCSSDDDSTSANFSNTVEYGDDVFDVEEAQIVDYGADESYYNYDYTLEGTSSDGVSFRFYAELYSTGTESFDAGSFEYYDDSSDEEYPDFFYEYSYITIDDVTYYVDGGDIVVSGNDTTYSISGALTTENGDVINVSYSGEFVFQ